MQSCSSIRDRLIEALTETSTEDDRSVLPEYRTVIQDLIKELRRILLQWREYLSVLDRSNVVSSSYVPSLVRYTPDDEAGADHGSTSVRNKYSI